MLAANLLAARFHVRGEFIRAWNFSSSAMDTRGVSIIDSMMNLPLLYWASEQSGDPRFRWLAEAHADTVAREFIRADGSICHVVEFDPLTGQKLREHGGQGHAPGSAGRRGPPGRCTGLRCLSDIRAKPDIWRQRSVRPISSSPCLAKRSCRCGISAHLRSIRWRGTRPLRRLPRAGCLSWRSCRRGGNHAAAGERIVRGLHEHYSSGDSAAEEGLIMQGTVHYPEGRGLNVPIIYGDYFYMEALAKLRGHAGLF